MYSLVRCTFYIVTVSSAYITVPEGGEQDLLPVVVQLDPLLAVGRHHHHHALALADQLAHLQGECVCPCRCNCIVPGP